MTRPAIACAACGDERPHKGRGWCANCYARWLRHGKPEGGPPKREEIKCGTVKGWKKHMRDRTEPCPPCRDAHNTDVREFYRERRKPSEPARQPRYTQPPVKWSDAERGAAGHAVLAGKDVPERRLLLEALGLVASDVSERKTA